MTKFSTALSILVLFLLATAAQAESLLDGKVSINVPNGFEKLSADVLKAKFPGQNSPTLAYGTPDAKVTIAAKAAAVGVADEELPAFKQMMRNNLQKARPQATFQADEILTINGEKWIRYVFISQASDGPIRNEMLLCCQEEQIFIINLNSTVVDYPTYSSALDKARNSLTVK